MCERFATRALHSWNWRIVFVRVSRRRMRRPRRHRHRRRRYSSEIVQHFCIKTQQQRYKNSPRSPRTRRQRRGTGSRVLG